MVVVVDAGEVVQVVLAQVSDRREEPPVARLGAQALEPRSERRAVTRLDGPDHHAGSVAQLDRHGRCDSSSFFRILPVGPLGSSARISTVRGYLYAATRVFTYATSSSSVAVVPGLVST